MIKTLSLHDALPIYIHNVEMDESHRAELISEAHFLRGFSYFLLASNFGDVPLRLISASEDSEEIMKPTSPEEEVWKQVIDDFKAAKEEIGRASCREGV